MTFTWSLEIMKEKLNFVYHERSSFQYISVDKTLLFLSWFVFLPYHNPISSAISGSIFSNFKPDSIIGPSSRFEFPNRTKILNFVKNGKYVISIMFILDKYFLRSAIYLTSTTDAKWCVFTSHGPLRHVRWKTQNKFPNKLSFFVNFHPMFIMWEVRQAFLES